MICTIIGNGPSLNSVPVEFLDKYPTFGTNRIYLKYIPTNYVCTNPLVLEQFKGDIAQLNCRKYLRGNPLNVQNQPQTFSKNAMQRVWEGFTVTFVCLQLAYCMGYKTVLLVGVDHRYIYDGKPNEKKILKGQDPNHFAPSYFSGYQWHNPDLRRSEAAYLMAGRAFEEDGRRIINLTKNTALDVFEKGQIEEWT